MLGHASEAVRSRQACREARLIDFDLVGLGWSVFNADAAPRASQAIGGPPGEGKGTEIWFPGHVEGDKGLKQFETPEPSNRV